MAMASVLRKIKSYRDEYRGLDLSNRSASLSFYTIISIFPMVLLLITLSGFVHPGGAFVTEITRLIDDFFPFHNAVILKNFESLATKRRAFSVFGGVGLLISSRLLYLNLERSVNELLRASRKRHFLLRRLLLLLWILGIMIVLFTPLFFEAIRNSLAYFHLNLPAPLASRGLFLLCACLMFLWVTFLMPTRRVRWTRVLLGGLLFSMTLEAGKVAFRWFAARNLVQYNLVYGSLASVVLGAMWIFYFYHMFFFFIYWTGRKETLTLLAAQTALTPKDARHKG